MDLNVGGGGIQVLLNAMRVGDILISVTKVYSCTV